MHSLAIKKPTGFWPFWSIYLMPRKVEAFLHPNKHVPEIADMVHIDHLFTFQEDSNKKNNNQQTLLSKM